ncbi:pilus assembly protein Flp/PilA [Eubacterium uniforme]|uniref:Pilus assembly protein Flp/PilA n=1 Tax=Eubacterium uniforme TaxID=39495 RepID=A0A1T4VMR6_9FIRM|nr:Flp family type IVb pilin [Eubacterium uniforme]SKA66260.1 pilus assembly protein Flp/PilA [Eubacterium uniforme]
MKKMLDFLKDENGQSMLEYGLIITLIALVVIAALTILGPKVAALFNKVSGQVNEP